MTSVYRERDRYDDSRSVASTRRGGDDDTRTYTKVTRYIIREDDDDDDDRRSHHTSHKSHHTHRRESPERERETQTVRITRREVDDRESVAATRRSVPTYVERDLTLRGGRDDARSTVTKAWEREEDTKDRELVIRRTEDRDDGRREVDRETLAVSKVDDRRDSQRYGYDVYRSGEAGRDRDLAHYTRTAEYYGPPSQPQTIIIRQDPIIIRERVRDDDYQIVRKSDVDEERSVARSVATTRRDEPRDEEYFYEKKVRERFDDRYDDHDRRSRRELSPGDSISQAGRGRDRSYSSDDSMVYVKRVEKEYSRESSRDNKKDLAAGVIAGVGAAELLRNHRKKEGKDASSGIGRIGKDIGAGALGAIAAEGIKRYRSKSRHRSKSRGRSEDSYDRHGRDSRRSRSRSSSRPNLKTLGALGLGAVAIAAAASAATRKSDQKKQKEHRRSRSRQRRRSRGSSVESLSDLENDPTADDARNPKKRNQRIAAAGAIGAAGAALIERARSKSRGRDGSGERSRIKEGLPIAAAGLGTAAIAGLYEKKKAKDEAEKIQKEQKRRSRSRSNTRGRSNSQYDDRSRSVERGDWGVEYGHGDVAGNNFGPEYYGRAPPQEPYYGNEGAIVPAGRTRSRSRSMSRDRRGQRAISPASEGRGGSLAGVGAAAGAAAAASEHERRKAEKRERKARKRAQSNETSGRDPYDESYGPQQMQQPWTPSPPHDPYASQQGFGNQYQSQFPPPPGSMPQGVPNQFQQQYQPHPAPSPQPPPGNYYQPPQNYPQPSYTPQPPHNAQVFPPPPPNSAPPQGGYQDQYNAGGAAPYGQQPRNRGTPEDNVSAGPPFPQYTPSTNDQHLDDGVNNSRSIDPLMPFPHPHTPAVHVHPPTSSSTPSLAIPHNYIPPAERPDASATNEQSSERRVQFAAPPEKSRSISDLNVGQHRPSTTESDDISPDSRRHRRRQHETNRGYEASDDTDLSPNSERRASKHNLSRDQSNDRSNQRRNSERTLHPDDHDSGRRRSTDSRQDRDKGRRSSRSEAGGKDQVPSPTDSDATIDLPARFDDKGRKRGDDPLAERIDDILKGKGTAGKVFGNFLDGLMGPNARDRRASDTGEGNDKRSKGKDRE